VLSDEIATTPHAGKILLGAQDGALARGWSLLIFNTGRVRALENKDIKLLVQHEVDGVLYATMYHRQVTVPPALAQFALVLLDARSTDPTIPAVVPDEVAGARTATEALLAHGHRHIGFANNRDAIPATSRRLQGYRDALRNAGIRYNPRLVVDADPDAPGGYFATRELLKRGPRPTGIFCFNDRMAMGAYRAAAEAGLKIPDDLSIVGFDNQELIAEGLYPALSTVALPHYEMGLWAVKALIDLIEQPGRAQTGTFPVLMPCPLVPRASVSTPPPQS
jgi:LacI family transcriptional regulator